MIGGRRPGTSHPTTTHVQLFWAYDRYSCSHAKPIRVLRHHTTTKGADDTMSHDDTLEQFSMALLRLAADHPAEYGRLAAALIVQGSPLASMDLQPEYTYRVEHDPADWHVRMIVELVDALEAGGLLTTIPGPKPRLCLTRAGFRALEALEAVATR